MTAATPGRTYAKTCDRCGATALRWQKSTRTGKFYLVETTGGPGVCGAPLPFQPHKCPEPGTQRWTPDGITEFTGTEWKLLGPTAQPAEHDDDARRPFCGYRHPERAEDFRAEDVEHEFGAADQHAAGVVHCRIACPVCRAQKAATTTATAAEPTNEPSAESAGKEGNDA